MIVRVQSTGRAPSISVELRPDQQETDGARACDRSQPTSRSTDKNNGLSQTWVWANQQRDLSKSIYLDDGCECVLFFYAITMILHVWLGGNLFQMPNLKYQANKHCWFFYQSILTVIWATYFTSLGLKGYMICVCQVSILHLCSTLIPILNHGFMLLRLRFGGVWVFAVWKDYGGWS